MKNKTLTFIKLLVLTFFCSILANTSVYAEESAPISISTAEDLINIKYNPNANYILNADIDMRGYTWLPFYFSGTLDGNGYSILNLTISEINYNTVITYDGNHKTYDTCFSGLFSQIDNAVISNLTLKNIRMDVTTDTNCFIGAIAGYSSNSTIDNCYIEGQLSLTVSSYMFGVGGIVGYGNGKISNTTADVTLICIDTNKEERDEQYLGGAVAAGYMDIDHCKIYIDGYVSDHGYVHNGGLMGMYIFYPKNLEYYGSITYNRVEGKITFFEDNTKRRAYCKPIIGEILIYEFEYGGNSEKFTKDERFVYDTDLLPHYCTDNNYTKEVTEATKDEHGYTTYTCDSCGYVYKDNYTSLNIYTPPVETEPPTTTITSSSTPTETTTDTVLSTDGKENPASGRTLTITLIAICAVLLFGSAIVIRKKGQ